MKRLTAWISILVLIALAGSCVAVVQTSGGRWVPLGVKSVSLGYDQDIIPVGMRKGPFRAIRLRVSGHPVHFIDLKVVFENGDRQDIPVDRYMATGEMSPVFDLRGGDRAIDKVVLKYRRAPIRRVGRKARSARVTLYGLR